MAVKTITITMEAYEILLRFKGEGQSFSQVIKEQLGRRTGRDLEAVLNALEFAEDTLDAVEAQRKARAGTPARAPRL